MKVARKNFQKGMPNCPHMIPARSNRGFGTWNAKSVIDNFNVHEACIIIVVSHSVMRITIIVQKNTISVTFLLILDYKVY